MSYMIYKDSLSRMYGSPGSGKSFVALDLALSLATGRFWGGKRLKAATVVYVMAEGQAVNGSRVEAWMSYHNVSHEQLTRFFAVPDAVMLTEYSARPFIDWVTEHQPTLAVLDTKNAMMIGDENSASDFATMRRTLDMVRKASGCCVLLIDHTGYEGTRARGSSAGTAAMDTEIRVCLDNSERPALITAEVTRDKAAEAGHSLAWRLVPEHPAAVLVPVNVPVRADRNAAAWVRSNDPVPTQVLDYTGKGEKSIVDLARLMMHDTCEARDPSRIGLSRAEAVKALLRGCGAEETGSRRSWSALKDLGWITPATDCTNDVGRHIWNAENGLIEDRFGDHP